MVNAVDVLYLFPSFAVEWLTALAVVLMLTISLSASALAKFAVYLAPSTLPPSQIESVFMRQLHVETQSQH